MKIDKTDEIAKTVGRNLMIAVYDSKITYDALAAMTNTSPAMISQIVHAKKVPSLSLLKRIADALEIEPASLLKGAQQ